MDSFYSEEELKEIGLKSYGAKVKISRNAKIYSPESISIGDNVRIDDFCILSGNIKLGSNIHISAYVALYGAGGIIMEDFTGISARSTVYSAMDEVGAHCVIFPGITIEEGSVIGTMTLANKDIPEWSIYIGQPASFLKHRNKGLLTLIP